VSYPYDYNCNCTGTGYGGKFCDQGNITASGVTSGVITSVNFPKFYPLDALSNWNITADEGYVINLLFTDFATEFCCDEVRIYNSTSLVAEYSGNFFLNYAEPPPLTIRGGFAQIEFESNYGYNADTGWRLMWTTSPTPECVPEIWWCQRGGLCYVDENDAYACNCQETNFTGTYCDRGTILIEGVDSGEFTSVNYPDLYPNMANSSVTLMADQGHGINLTFVDFSTERGYDIVSIYGAGNDSVFLSYSGKSIPEPIALYENTVVVEFYSGYSSQDRGWKLQWSTFELQFDVVCPILQAPGNGSVSC